ncbi:hypoxanthine phosphoribosyltransferase [Rhizobium subbaraonis]|jgi:hypoxanthine phosphoribosyltransferase|uniref:Hypoxanthine phosphoribosyltransferase n=1 Tax=Rhizobium subbaraonis TaxID=908946 RepID=A0A285UPF0_9HYPH|nr:hypoxanthine phosphoribosyltransferase [Rhizobium subbaraonis]SOC43702.1 hypoxanthine phosphoribosyltransferase [Rhizobium subbaraonis]
MQVVRGKKIETLYSAEEIARRNSEMAAQIKSGPTKDLLVISILKGSFIFAADLIRAMHATGLAPEVEFITLSSYGKGTTSQTVKIVKDIDSDVHGRDILLIDDILESGRTLQFAKELLLERGANHVTIAVLLDKRVKRQTDLEADYVGFECPDHFVVGYGMDVAYAFRELPFVGVVTGDAE